MSANNIMDDPITELSANLMRDCAETTDKAKRIAIDGKLSAEEALTALAAIFRSSEAALRASMKAGRP